MRNGVAHGRVLEAVARTWPGVITSAVETRAREHIEAGRFDEAAAVLEQAAERYGPDAVPNLLLAYALNSAERHQSALEWADRAVGNEPENADAHWVRANALFDLGRRDEASESLWKAVDLSPDRGTYYMELAWHGYLHLGYAETKKLIDRALDLAPDDPWAHHTAARIFGHHLRHKRAQHHFERAGELDPSSAAARYELAGMLQVRGRISRGVRCVFETEPDSEDEHRANYDAVLRRWSWRWYEWALRAAFLLNVIDWILPTPGWVGGVLAGLLVTGVVVPYVRSLSALPAPCRSHLWERGRRGFFAGAAAVTATCLAGAAAMLLVEPNALQHLGVLGVLIAGYVHWYRRASRISGA